MEYSGGKVFFSRDIRNHWIWKNPVKYQWWTDLVMSANYKDTKRIARGKIFVLKRGQLEASVSFLARRWEVSRPTVAAFLKLLETDGMINRQVFNTSKHIITICNYDNYQSETSTPPFTTFDTNPCTPKNAAISCKPESCEPPINDPLYTSLYTSLYNPLYSTFPILHDKTPAPLSTQTPAPQKPDTTPCKPESCEPPIDDPLYTSLYTSLYNPLYTLLYPNLDTNRIKDNNINSLNRGLSPSNGGDASPSSKSKKNKKSPSLVTKGRKVFEACFAELYGDSYYWTAKDAAAMKQLLNKIKFSRENRQPPLPTDDDSLCEALRSFLTSINDGWIMNNFSVTKINSQYNDIISEIKNRNGNERSKQNKQNTDDKRRGYDACTHSAEEFEKEF